MSLYVSHSLSLIHISNLVKQELSKAVEEKKELLENQAILDKINREKIDITLPSYKLDQGSLHPLSTIVTELEDLFLGMGYQIAEGPEVESDYFNFELMNLPKGHPARDMQDTFYIDENTLMRTQDVYKRQYLQIIFIQHCIFYCYGF